MTSTVHSDIQVLAGSSDGHAVLQAVQDRPLNQSELADRIALSRPSVGRKLSDLAARDWVAHGDEGYQITTVGRIVLREYSRLVSSIESIVETEESDEDVREIIDYLAESPKQAHVLVTLQEGTARQNELIERSSVSRSTVSRSLDAFEDRDLLYEDLSTGGYALTPRGAQIADAYDHLRTAIGVVNERKQYLLMLRADSIDIPLDVLAAGTVTVASREHPHAPIVKFIERMADEHPAGFRSISPVVSDIYNQTIDPFVPTGMSMELIIDSSTLTESKSEYPDNYDTARTANNIDVYIYPGEITFGLMIVDDERGMMGAFDEDGNHRGSLAGADETVVTWMDDVYNQYKREACHLSEV